MQRNILETAVVRCHRTISRVSSTLGSICGCGILAIPLRRESFTASHQPFQMGERQILGSNGCITHTSTSNHLRTYHSAPFSSLVTGRPFGMSTEHHPAAGHCHHRSTGYKGYHVNRTPPEHQVQGLPCQQNATQPLAIATTEASGTRVAMSTEHHPAVGHCHHRGIRYKGYHVNRTPPSRWPLPPPEHQVQGLPSRGATPPPTKQKLASKGLTASSKHPPVVNTSPAQRLNQIQ